MRRCNIFSQPQFYGNKPLIRTGYDRKYHSTAKERSNQQHSNDLVHDDDAIIEMYLLGRDAEIFGQWNEGVYDKVDTFLIENHIETL